MCVVVAVSEYEIAATAKDTTATRPKLTASCASSFVWAVNLQHLGDLASLFDRS